MKDLLSLQVGDIITTDKASTGEAFLQIEGKRKFLGKPGQFRGHRAVRITTVHAEPADPSGDKKSDSPGAAK